MTARRAIVRGVVLAALSPRLLGLLWLLLVLAIVPAGLAMRQSIADSLGDSRAHREIRGEMEMGWLGEFHDKGGEIEATLTPLRLSPLAPLENLEGWAGGALFEAPWALVGLGAVFALLWVFLLGGAIDRFAANGGPFRLGAFLAAGSASFPRLLRLSLLSAPLYWASYRLGRSLFGRVEHLTRDVTVERTVLVWNLGALALVVFLLITIHLVFSYAKIATVVEGRRSTFLALGRAVGFVARHPTETYGVELGLAILGILTVALYTTLAPGPGGDEPWSVVTAVLAGQVYLLARLLRVLALCAARTTLYLGGRQGPGHLPG